MKLIRSSRRRAAGALCLLSLLLIGSADVALSQTRLDDGRAYRDDVPAGGWDYYYIDVQDWHSWVGFRLYSMEGNPDIYVKAGSIPTLDDWDFRPRLNSRNEYVFVRESTNPAIESERYFVGVYGRTAADYFVGGKRFQESSTRPGMGSIPYNGGVTFRVWAPNADEVRVAGEFNGWNSNEPTLVAEGEGYWSLDYRNARVNDEYKYVIKNGSNILWKVDPRTEEVVNSVGNGVVFDPAFNWSDGGFQMPNWNELVIYEMHVGTLNDTPGGRPGDLDDAIAKLDHLADLGVNAVKVMPINEFPGDFSWGYNQSYPFSVESIYGGPKAFKRFVNEAHRRGIAVLLDVVYNHWGPNDLDLWRFDGWHQGPWGGIYFYNDSRASTPWGDTRPDFGRGEVRQFIRDNVVMWLTDFHVDGLRVDSTLNIRSHSGGDLPEGWSLLQWINDEIDRLMPWKIAIAEDMQNNEWITKSTGAGGAGFDSQWDAQFVHPVRAALEAADDNSRDMWSVRDAISHYYNGDAFDRVIYTESHDEVANGRTRVPEAIWPGNAGSWYSRKRSTLGAVLVMTSPGIPMIFQGQEILEDGWFADTDPVDWSKLNTYSGIHQLYKDLIRLRRNWYDHTRGLRGNHLNVFHVNNSEKMIAFHRWDQGGAGDDVIVVCNFRNRIQNGYRIGLPGPGVWSVRFNSDWDGYSPDYDNFFTPDVTAEAIPYDGMPYSGVVDIAPYTAVLLSQDN
ncbi:MAG: alpha-amylase family glycosyl hydrolase [Phycisphaerales bacterium]